MLLNLQCKQKSKYW